MTTSLAVESVENPHSDYYEIKLACGGMTWKAGEHGLFELPGKAVTGRTARIFSIASVPEEGCVMIGTRTGKEPSSFKSNLIAMKKGEIVTVTEPFGEFVLKDETTPVILFASGVGVTPIRALLKETQNNQNRTVEVVYASPEFYLYDKKITEIADNNPKISLYKTTSRDETTDKVKALAAQYKNTAYYYISGAPIVITSTSEMLQGVGITENRIISDSFMGYE